ncbi:hypothetical protein IU500_23540 [Nocardia terpenica]|uniref:Uncharacterized protein n=1 Tax=Nocardia terpenica TaxID=455432 RepID=A0A161Z5V3_9NOCA|nr:hypothetical protein [Nocardia terpenica]KZM75284.1 hypothetical protein AWN90_17930 [Nocardia terpenica]MBF6063641.1 hypothetical protein [Nocardia terpenica]MBF6107017.1 hypothetical protein [Nocardia terpenica]MBF6114190.1 hypothetical protein [Nocardia terpenica]MBF6121723.1 hypothetical protein [Nocardia terpenica]
MELSAIERRVAEDRRVAAQERTAEAELRLAASLYELAEGFLATKQDGSGRDRAPAALEPAQEAVLIRLRWLTAGHVSAQFAGQVQEALRLFEQAARTIGHRELATATIRQACDAYHHVAQRYPLAAGVCADGLSKCGVWLCRLDPSSAVAASSEAVRIRAGLFAGDPEQSTRYLASLNMLLRTLMIGRPRKQALAMYRERYAAWTSPEMTTRLRETRAEDLDFTAKTHAALAKLDCKTLERAGRLTQHQILYQTEGDLSTIEEINWKLGLVGLKPLAAGALPDLPSKPVDITASFGTLSVRCTAPDALEQVRDAVIAAYAADGVRAVGSGFFRGMHQPLWEIPEPQLNTSAQLGDDVVLIERSGGKWISVMSLNWELTPTGSHPLALRLAQQWPVLAVNTTENLAYELCWYVDGAATQYAALGRPAGQPALAHPLAPLDFATLADYGADYASETQVRAAFGNTAMFAKLTHLPSSGIRQAGQSRPLAEYGDRILFFRKGAA